MKEDRPVAPCGIDCFNCEVYEENITDQIRSRVAVALNLWWARGR